MIAWIETEDGIRLEAGIARPHRGVNAVRVATLHDLAKLREATDGVEVGVLPHVVEIGVAARDCRLEKTDGPIRQRLTLRLVFPAKGLRGQSVGAGGVVGE